jgi:hypothetical protein
MMTESTPLPRLIAEVLRLSAADDAGRTDRVQRHRLVIVAADNHERERSVDQVGIAPPSRRLGIARVDREAKHG